MNRKIVFITGAAQGIGFEMARQFGTDGSAVVITDADAARLAKAKSILQQEGLEILDMVVDVTDESQITNAVQETVRRYGRLDVLINNAGLQFISPIEEFPTDQFEYLIRVMLVAPFITTKYILPIMKEQKSGRIINMASVNGLVGFPGKAAYNSAKHGVIGLTRVTALEGAEFNITANALCPGYVDTELVHEQLAALAIQKNIPVDKVMEEIIFPLVPQKRLLTPAEIANYALFLSSDKAIGITGQAVVIDGGYTVQ